MKKLKLFSLNFSNQNIQNKNQFLYSYNNCYDNYKRFHYDHKVTLRFYR